LHGLIAVVGQQSSKAFLIQDILNRIRYINFIVNNEYLFHIYCQEIQARLHSIIDIERQGTFGVIKRVRLAAFEIVRPDSGKEQLKVPNRQVYTSKQMVRWLALTILFLCIAVIAGLAAQAAKRPSPPPTFTPAGLLPYPPNMVYPVRVGIVSRASQARIAVWSPGAVFIDFTPIFQLKPQLVYLIANGRITEYATGRTCVLPSDKRARIASQDFRIWCNNRWWRGTLELIHFPNALTVINLLDLENYLMGVVPAEMPAIWHIEALKAQAVAARSYAYAHLGNGSKWWKAEGYDLVPDVRDQAYKGLAAETPKTNVAVARTMGIILKDSGRVKPGFYRAWVGDDAFENLNIRTKVVPSSVLEKLCGVKDILGVTVRAWDPNGNAHDIQLLGKKKTADVSGVALAQRLGLATAGILDVKESGQDWIFTYRGPGNGARGLSQHGANMLAQRGWNWMQILQQYYQDPGGRLQLDYMDQYHAAAAAAARRAAPAMVHQEPAHSEDEN
jgi:stage II sporulation protein D